MTRRVGWWRRPTRPGLTTTTEYFTDQLDGVNAVTVTTPDGVASTETRDVLGRVTQVTDNLNDGKPTRWACPGGGVPGVSGPGHGGGHGRVGCDHDRAAGRVRAGRRDDRADWVGGGDPVRRGQNTVTTGHTTTGNLADAEATSTQRMDARGQVIGTDGTRADAGPTLTTQSRSTGSGGNGPARTGSPPPRWSSTGTATR